MKFESKFKKKKKIIQKLSIYMVAQMPLIIFLFYYLIYNHV